MTYNRDDALKISKDYFGGDDLAAGVFVSKYALKDAEGTIYEASPAEMHKRLATEFARIENKYPNPMQYDEIYQLLSNWDVVPQGSPMSAIGNPYQLQSLSNCFVIESPHDSYGGILKTDEEQAQIMKRRGGVGFDISTIRPKGLVTTNAAKTTDGIGVFMERFSNTCREVAQGGRRGALMLSLSINHPEIRTFLNIKKDLKKVTGANISIRLSDEFMLAVKNDLKFKLRFPIDKSEPALVEDWIEAKQLWNEIIEAAHQSAEPGLLFWDTMIRRSPADSYTSCGFTSTSTNPCAELLLCPDDSCRLLLVNLHNFVENKFTQNAKFNYDHYRNVVMKAQRLMDDLVDLEIEAIDKIINKIENDKEPEDVKAREFNLWKRIKTKAQNGRRTGLGITALGDAIAELGMKYGSDQSIDFTSEVYRNHCVSAYRSSCIMAQERGAFPVYDENLEKDNEFLNQVKDEEDIRKLMSIAGRRNIALLTTAPAGSVSIMTQTTSGCEPVFKIQYKRRKKINVGDENTPVDYVDPMGDKWQEFTVSHHGFNEWKRITGLSDDDIEKSPYWGATANDIDWLKKIELQAAAQKWVDHAISNTVNLPENVSVDTVKQIYMKGWETGCKGVTIYREGSRSGVLVSDDTKTVKSSNPEDIELKFQELINKNPEYRPKNILMSPAPKREKELPCDIHRVNVKGESYLVVIGLLNGQPYEIFAGLSAHVEVPKKVKSGILIKNGKNSDGLATYNLKIPFGDDDHIMFKDIVNLFDNPMHGAFTRTLSLSLRHGVKIQHIVEQLRKDKHSDIFSFSSCIARVLSKNYIKDGTSSRETCPGCGGKNLNYQQGCVTCMDCGHSKCG